MRTKFKPGDLVNVPCLVVGYTAGGKLLLATERRKPHSDHRTHLYDVSPCQVDAVDAVEVRTPAAAPVHEEDPPSAEVGAAA